MLVVFDLSTKFSVELGASNKLLVNSGPSRQLLLELRRRGGVNRSLMVTAAPRGPPVLLTDFPNKLASTQDPIII